MPSQERRGGSSRWEGESRGLQPRVFPGFAERGEQSLLEAGINIWLQKLSAWLT